MIKLPVLNSLKISSSKPVEFGLFAADELTSAAGLTLLTDGNVEVDKPGRISSFESVNTKVSRDNFGGSGSVGVVGVLILFVSFFFLRNRMLSFPFIIINSFLI